MKFMNLIAASTFSLMLAACGGGGSGSGNDPSPGPGPSPTRADLQMVVPTPTYPAGSTDLKSFNEINQFRASLGLGLWAQNTKLDLAAQNHVNYLMFNNEYAHTETPGLPGFTGIDATQRAAYVGYIAHWVGDVGSVADDVAGLIDTVYHRSALMNQQMTEVGIANSGYEFISFSDALKSQHNASNFTAVYPLNGQTNVPLFMMAESVNPFPNIELPSAPISFISAQGTQLKVIKFTVTQRGASMPLTTQLITQENDPNKVYLMSNEAYLAAVKPFLPNTTYDVQFEGTINSTPVGKNWSFSTNAS